jgi:hypothetical protein
MNKLSIYIPSHGTYEASLQTLEECYALSRRTGVEVVVSDNSGDPSKSQAWMQKCDESFKYMVSSFKDNGPNARNAFNATSGQWVCFVSDDDQMVALQGFNVNELADLEGVVGYCPTMALHSEEHGIYRISNMSLHQSTPVERVRHYLETNGGTNSTLFSCFRRDVIADLIRDLEQHPTDGGYFDWAHVLSMASSGMLISHPKLLYIYNNRNWLTMEQIEQNSRRLFSDVGLADDNAEILTAHLALDSFTLINRFSSGLRATDKLVAGEFALNSYFLSFCNILLDSKVDSMMASNRIRLCRQLAGWASNTPQRIAALLVIIEEWNPGLAEKYIEFMRKIIDPEVFSYSLSAVGSEPVSTLEYMSGGTGIAQTSKAIAVET